MSDWLWEVLSAAEEYELPLKGHPWEDEDWQEKQGTIEDPYGDSLAVDYMHMPLAYHPDRGLFVGGAGQSHMMEQQKSWNDEDAGLDQLPYNQRGQYQGNVNVVGNKYQIHWPEFPVPEEVKYQAHQQVHQNAEDARARAWEEWGEWGGPEKYQKWQDDAPKREEMRIRNLKNQRAEMFTRFYNSWKKENEGDLNAFVQSPEYPEIKATIDGKFPEIRESSFPSKGAVVHPKTIVGVSSTLPLVDNAKGLERLSELQKRSEIDFDSPFKEEDYQSAPHIPANMQSDPNEEINYADTNPYDPEGPSIDYDYVHRMPYLMDYEDQPHLGRWGHYHMSIPESGGKHSSQLRGGGIYRTGEQEYTLVPYTKAVTSEQHKRIESEFGHPLQYNYDVGTDMWGL